MLLCVICVCLAACEIWTRQDGVASSNGMLLPYMSLSECLKVCLESTACLAVDFSVYVCVVHTDIADMATKFNVSSFTQYTLNRACLPPTSTSTSSTFSAVSTETSTLSSFVGKQFGVFFNLWQLTLRLKWWLKQIERYRENRSIRKETATEMNGGLIPNLKRERLKASTFYTDVCSQSKCLILLFANAAW